MKEVLKFGNVAAALNLNKLLTLVTYYLKSNFMVRFECFPLYRVCKSSQHMLEQTVVCPQSKNKLTNKTFGATTHRSVWGCGFSFGARGIFNA